MDSLKDKIINTYIKLQIDENFNKMEMFGVMALQIPVEFIIKGAS